MPRITDLLEDEGRTVDLEPGDFDRLLNRRERKQRSRRRAAGTLAFVVVLATAAMLFRSFVAPPVPVDRRTPGLVAPGPLAYFVDGDLYVADWDGTNPVLIADGRPATEDCSAGYWADPPPIWSPDGRYLAARHGTCEGGTSTWWDVVVFDADGDLVTTFPSEGWLISWSPDSAHIAVWTSWGQTIGVFGLDGELEKHLPVPGGLMAAGDFDPVWSQDGTSLMVPRGVVVPLDGSAPYKLPRDDPRTEQDATLSPDGSRVAYVDPGFFQTGSLDQPEFVSTGKLIVAAADGSGAREMVGSWVERPVWSPTGEQIAFAYSDTDDGLYSELRVLDVATGEIRMLVAEHGSAVLGPFEFSPEGDRILFENVANGGRGEPSLWRIDVDGTDAHQLVAGAHPGDWRSIGT